MKKNILLINPWIADFKAFDFWIKPLGLLFLGAILKRNGYEVQLVDCLNRLHPSVSDRMKFRENGTGKFPSTVIEKPALYRHIPRRYKIYGIPEKDFIADLEKIQEPTAILVTSSMTYWYPGVQRTIEVLRNSLPGVPVILGGIYADLCPRHAEKHSGADHVIKGPHMRNILEQMKNFTGPIPFQPADFSRFPPPALELYMKINSYPLLTSAGCPYKCSYCAGRILQPDFVRKSPDSIIEEIRQAVEMFGVRHFAIYDDALLVDPESHIIPILKEVCGMDLHFYTPNGIHARYVNRDTARLLKRAGFDHIRLSMESSDEEWLKNTGNKVRHGDVERAVEFLKTEGFDTESLGAYIMMGAPGQTADSCRRSILKAHDMGLMVYLSRYSPVPGTAEFIRLEESGMDLSDPLTHNNLFFQYENSHIPPEESEILRKTAFLLNRELMNP